MVKKSKLLLALDAHKGRDYDAEKRKKQLKAGEKRKREKAAKNVEDEDDDSEEETTLAIPETVKPAKQSNGILKSSKTNSKPKPTKAAEEEWESALEDEIDEDDDDEILNDTTIPQPTEPVDASASEAEQESDVPLSDLEAEDLEDTIPHQRLTINNGPALTASTKRVAVIKPKMAFHQHNSLISPLPPSSDVIPDPNDDLTRELEFYRIAKDAAVTARSLLKKEKIPFSRPADYFAEMVKSDEHMGKVKKKMYDEAAGKKASEEARKLRDAKKFGKAVQVAKEQERAKEKRGTLEKIKELKRKRKGQTADSVMEGDNLFQEISLEDGPAKDKSGRERGPGGQAGAKRQKRDSKFGFGGKKRFSKSGDAVSSGDLSGFSAGRMKGKGKPGKKMTTKRLGKSKRTAGKS